MTDEQMKQAEALANEARLDAKAFSKNTVYTGDGDPIRLIANAERLDQYSDTIAALVAEVRRLREGMAGIVEFGQRHTGHGYSCAQLARAALRGEE